MTATQTTGTTVHSHPVRLPRRAGFAPDRQHRLTRAAQPGAAQSGAERSCGRPTRDCHHPGQPHRHGQRVAYVKDRCRCNPCTAANTAASHAADRGRALGYPSPLVDAGDVRAHLEQLRRAHIGYQQIAGLSGTSATHIREIAGTVVRSGNRPPIRRIRPDLAARLLAIEPTPANRTAHCHVDATGTRRRLQALVAIGWPPDTLADHLGRTPAELHRSLTCTTAITEHTARHIRNLYDRLWDTQPPRATPAQRQESEWARVHADNHGWPPPLAWDDIDTDRRPHSGPDNASAQANPQLDEIAVERAVAGDGIRLGDLSPAEQTAVVHRLTERGTSIRDIADLLATATRTVSRRRRSASAA